MPEEFVPMRLPETCPTCPGAPKLERGYGLAGGGMGEYVFCDTCNFFQKHLEATGSCGTCGTET
jgi:hypothetical protein